MRGSGSRHTVPPESGPGPAIDADAVDTDAADSTPRLASPPRLALMTAATRAGFWLLLACGPIALLFGTGSSGGPARDARPEPPRRSALGPAGWAQMYVTAYLSEGPGSDAVRAFYPDAPTGASARRQVDRTTVIGAREVRPGYWSVTIAAEESSWPAQGISRPLGLHYYTAPVFAAGGPEAGGTGPAGSSPRYIAAALPAETAGPAPGTPPSLGYNNTAPVLNGPLQSAITQFLAAYLTGTGDLDRYLSPGQILSPVTPAPYRQVQTETIVPRTDLPGGGATVPADGATTQVLVTADAQDGDGQHWPLTYALTLRARAGRWEVTTVAAAPDLAAAPPTPVAATPTTAPADSPAPPDGTAPAGASAGPSTEPSVASTP
jgi:hypothetical protein